MMDSPDPTIERLLMGMKRFRRAQYEHRPDRMRDLVENGQKPDVLVIGCSDSRVDPALLTQASPGELFVVRNVAALVPPYKPDGQHHSTSAAIEYAVRYLKVRHIVVLGHARCGGIQSLIRLSSGYGLDGDFIAPWVSIASDICDQYVGLDDPEGAAAFTEDCRRQALDKLAAAQPAIEQAAVRKSVHNLMTFPAIRAGVETGELRIHGWWFDLCSGKLKSLDRATDSFTCVEEK